ncbi:MAG: hypothetical protein WCO71_08865 [Pseudomonadota bacterium]
MLNPIAFLVLCLSVSTCYSTPPVIPKFEMAHRYEFVDNKTGVKSRAYNSDGTQGIEIWDAAKKSYVSDGIYVFRRKDGTVATITTWSHGVKSGSFQEYNNKGVLLTDGSNLEGNKSGEWKTYTDNGRISTKNQYLDGFKDGECIDYYTGEKTAGQLHFVQHWKNGDLNGEHEQYNEKSQKVIWGPYLDNRKEGTWHEDFGNGRTTQQWVKGVRAGKG